MGTDTEPPTGTMSTSIDHNTINASIDATDNFGIDHYEYYLDFCLMKELILEIWQRNWEQNLELELNLDK